jgi:putative ABC transport system substrate-binding protein
MPAIGYLHLRGPDDDLAAAFRRGLRDGGFIDGKDVRVEYYDRLPGLAKELVALPVSVLAASGGESTVLAAKSASSTIPIVFAMSSDPVKLGLAKSYNRPGTNVTGINILTAFLETKRLGLLHDLVPSAAKMGFLVDSDFPLIADKIREVGEAARAIGIPIQVLRVNSEREIDAAFETIAQERIGALAVGASPFLDTRRHLLVALAARAAVPTMYHFR